MIKIMIWNENEEEDVNVLGKFFVNDFSESYTIKVYFEVEYFC